MLRQTSAIIWRQTWQDLACAVRTLWRAPGFSLAAVLGLPLAMGANTAMFSAIEGVLLRPLTYRDAGQLCVLWKTVPRRGIEWDWTSAPTVADWREQGSPVFEDAAMVPRPEGSSVTMRVGSKAGAPERIQASVVSGNFFAVLGVAPHFTLTTNPGPLDLLGGVAGGGTYEQLVEHAQEGEFGGDPCLVAPLDALIRMKRAAGRPKDLEALAELERIRAHE